MDLSFFARKKEGAVEVLRMLLLGTDDNVPIGLLSSKKRISKSGKGNLILSPHAWARDLTVYILSEDAFCKKGMTEYGSKLLCMKEGRR